jgi:hypothetical protein
MGVNVSTTVTKTINENVQKVTVNSMQSITSTNNQSTNLNQVIDIQIEGNLTCGGNLSLNNDAHINMSSLSQSSADQKNTMAQDVTQALKAEAKSQTDQMNDGLNPANINIATTINDAINRTESEQILNLTQAFTTTIEQSNNINQTIKFLVGPTANVIVAGNCIFDNKSSVEYTAQIVTNATIDTVLSQTDVQEAMAEWDTTVSQKNEGLTVGAIVGIIIGIIAFIVIIALMAHYLPPYVAKQKAKQGK